MNLQDALAAASAPGTEIWVAIGTYWPDRGGGHVVGDRSASFQLQSGVAIYGGFDGTETSLAENAGLYGQTVLDGDLGRDDVAGFVNIAENSIHVVDGSGTDPTARLDGFLITRGNASPPVGSGSGGGGIVVVDGSPTIVNCIIAANISDQGNNWGGGGMQNSNASPELRQCSFVGNAITGNGGGGTGGCGMYNSAGSSPLLIDCLFEANAPLPGHGVNGGAMNNDSASNPTLVNCSFVGNEAIAGAPGAGGKGGAVLNCKSSNPTLINCTFSGNVATGGGLPGGGGSGAGIYNADTSYSTTINCAFSQNSADGPIPEFGGGGAGIFSDGLPPAIVTNCIFWNNSDSAGLTEQSQVRGPATISYSCVQGWTGALAGVANMGLDPLFLDPDGIDGIAGTSDDDLCLTEGSPCVDAGNNAALPADSHDLDGDGDSAESIPVDQKGSPRFLDEPAAPDTGAGASPIVDLGPNERVPCTGQAGQALTGCPDAISVSIGGVQSLELDGGLANAGKLYFLLGSASQTSPGVPVDSVFLPLDIFDQYFLFTLNSPNQAPLKMSLGTLAPDLFPLPSVPLAGTASASFTLPAGSSPILSGLTLSHAFVVFDFPGGSGKAIFASNAVQLVLAP